ncbi:MAG: putative nitrogen fixation protein NifT [Oscillatoria sp. PMC 1051.18]|uniref:putative nitrogen fixation protein NifT n=1 Tax=Oscillatoria salina TaxID=331517 RepID=UPI0013BA33A8|nr:putative nitrogen fixation protein NifT [Oscillatoria salina]MBZ8181701.1 putative nitrogen fixation protein NifT [Oscillatoria salina IIICB1]MEC4894950.1 putative nitrogen fixation protein NifT [Oscillatoria sp. PMC 1050.18]MEC5031382.1 putative nitrogen fixation protein NifT [Oscillatoria sp. PMC 1051.18]NET89622.1 putative nitrogen fixation protein NifT [Kamptonema sp. SIO1D9]
MKVMLRKNAAGHLSVYVAKKDLEEEVVSETVVPEGKILTLTNGWELQIANLPEPIKLPQTIDAKKL